MSTTFLILTVCLIIASVGMIVIILVQRPQGGGLAGAFGGAGGAGTESVFGGRVGDALTWATVVAFLVYLSVAITLNKLDTQPTGAVAEAEQQQTLDAQRGEVPGQIEADIQQQLGDDVGVVDEADLRPTDELPPELREQIEERLRERETPRSAPAEQPRE